MSSWSENVCTLPVSHEQERPDEESQTYVIVLLLLLALILLRLLRLRMKVCRLLLLLLIKPLRGNLCWRKLLAGEERRLLHSRDGCNLRQCDRPCASLRLTAVLPSAPTVSHYVEARHLERVVVSDSIYRGVGRNPAISVSSWWMSRGLAMKRDVLPDCGDRAISSWCSVVAYFPTDRRQR